LHINYLAEGEISCYINIVANKGHVANTCLPGAPPTYKALPQGASKDLLQYCLSSFLLERFLPTKKFNPRASEMHIFLNNIDLLQSL